jgi:hypothetical protein
MRAHAMLSRVIPVYLSSDIERPLCLHPVGSFTGVSILQCGFIQLYMIYVKHVVDLSLVSQGTVDLENQDKRPSPASSFSFMFDVTQFGQCQSQNILLTTRMISNRIGAPVSQTGNVLLYFIYINKIAFLVLPRVCCGHFSYDVVNVPLFRRLL